MGHNNMWNFDAQEARGDTGIMQKSGAGQNGGA